MTKLQQICTNGQLQNKLGITIQHQFYQDKYFLQTLFFPNQEIFKLVSF